MMTPDSTPPADGSPSPSPSPSPSSPPEGFYWERARRGATPWVIGAIGLAAVGVGQFVPVRHHVESDLRARSLSALRSAGLTDLDVQVVGRDAELVGHGTGTRDTDLERAAAIVSGVEGVRVVSTRLAAPGEGPASGPLPTSSTPAAPTSAPATATTSAPATTTAATTTSAPATTTPATTSATPTTGASETGTGAPTTTIPSTTIPSTTTPTPTSTPTSAAPTPTPTAATPTPTPTPSQPGSGPGRDEVQVVREALKELRPILFAKDSARLSSAARTTVRTASAIVAAHPSVRVRIDGHTDDLGDWDVNKELSAARADSVRQAMIADGVDGGQLSTFAWSEDRPPVPNTSGANRVRNRSTALIVLP